MKSNRIVPFFVLLFAFFLNAEFLFSESERREWTSNGVTVIGACDPSRDTAEDRITLESSNGSRQTLSLKDLSEEDRAYVEAKRKEIGWEPMPDPGAQHIYALLVGVNDYKKYQDLNYAVRDIELLHEQLLKMHIPSGNIRMLSSGSSIESLPTKENIEEELDRLLGVPADSERGSSASESLVKKGDLVFIALSGHGTQTPNGAYFMPADASEDKGKLESSSISIDALQRRISESEATFKWLVVDACRSDPPTLAEHIGERKSADFSLTKLQTILNPPPGMIVMQSCSPNESSYESEGLQQGIFTSTLIEGLQGQADMNGDGSVTMTELCGYVSDATRNKVWEERHQTQTPRISNALSDFVVIDGLLVDGLSRDVWNEAEGCYRQACLSHERCQYRKALEEIRHVLELTEGAAAGSAERQKYLNETRNIEQSLETDASRLYGDAAALVSQEDFDGALKKIEEALSLFPAKKEYLEFKKRISSLKEAQGYYQAAYRALNSSDFTSASTEIEKALAMNLGNTAYVLLKRLIDAGLKPDTGFGSGVTGKFGVGTYPGEKRILTVKGIDFTFCWCPPGEFEMDRPELEKGRYNTKKQHRVCLTKGFWLLESELTQEQWTSVMGTTVQDQRNRKNAIVYQTLILFDLDSLDLNSYLDSFVCRGIGPNYPMYYVDWKEAMDFCRRLCEVSGENVTLPSDA